jgi:hypothetical protein
MMNYDTIEELKDDLRRLKTRDDPLVLASAIDTAQRIDVVMADFERYRKSASYPKKVLSALAVLEKHVARLEASMKEMRRTHYKYVDAEEEPLRLRKADLRVLQKEAKRLGLKKK